MVKLRTDLVRNETRFASREMMLVELESRIDEVFHGFVVFCFLNIAESEFNFREFSRRNHKPWLPYR